MHEIINPDKNPLFMPLFSSNCNLLQSKQTIIYLILVPKLDKLAQIVNSNSKTYQDLCSYRCEYYGFENVRL